MKPTDTTFLPPGYIFYEDEEGSSFAVPQFLVPAAHSSFDAFRVKNSLESEIIQEVGLIIY